MAHRLAQKHPAVAWLVDHFAGPVLNASVNDVAISILSHNSQRFHPAVNELIRSKGMTYSCQDLRTTWDHVFQTIQEINSTSLKTLSRIDRMESRIDRMEQEALFRAEKRNAFASLQSSVYLLGTFAAAADNPQLARHIQVVGTAGLEIGKAIDAFREAQTAAKAAGTAVSVGSCVTLVGGIVSSFMMLASLFNSGPNIGSCPITFAGFTRDIYHPLIA
jgi:hypothetical protein